MSSRFGPSGVHQREARSSLFGDFDRKPARAGTASPARPAGNPYSQSYGQSYGGYATTTPAAANGNYSSAYPSSSSFPSTAATPNKRGQYSDAVLDELESQNEQEVEGMSARVRMLRDLSVAIGDEIRDSSRLADKMNDQFENARVRLRGTMNRMLVMAKRTGVGWRAWLAFFAAVVLLFWYVWLF